MRSSLKRKQYIQKALDTEGSLRVNVLAEELSVSEMTIRRDLKELEQEGILKRTHGGAVKEVGRRYEPPFNLRQQQHIEEKQRIAQQAVKFVSEGDTIAIDSGTTTIEFAKLLMNFHDLTIVTPSLHIAFLFMSHPSIRTIISGGEVRSHEGSLIGEFTTYFFQRLYFDLFFLSTAAVDCNTGFTEYIIEDASIKRITIDHSKKTIALMNSKKFGQTAFARVCGFKDIDALITGAELTQEMRTLAQSSSVETYIQK